MGKNSSPARTRITVTQKRREQIEAANGLCTSLAADLGLLDMKTAALEVQKTQKRRQLQVAFMRRKATVESAAFDNDLDLREWSYDAENGVFVRGKGQPNLSPVPAPVEEPTGEEVAETDKQEGDVPDETPVVVPRGGGSLDD